MPESSPNGEIRWTHQHGELILPPRLPLYVWWQFYPPSDPGPVWPLGIHSAVCSEGYLFAWGEQIQDVKGRAEAKGIGAACVTDRGSKSPLLFRHCASPLCNLSWEFWICWGKTCQGGEKGESKGQDDWMEGVREAMVIERYPGRKKKKKKLYYGIVLSNSYYIIKIIFTSSNRKQ